MKRIRITLLTFVVLINSIFTTGCWNYKEVDKLLIVAGVAIDKGIDNQFQMTVEVIQISSSKDTKMTSKFITAEGKTMFDAARNIISLSGKRLYWSHAQIIILSKEIASEGVTRALDWYNRDTETREDIHILVSKEASAKEIFEGQATIEDIKSFILGEVITNEISLSKAPIVDILRLDIALKSKGTSAVIPTVNLVKLNGKMVPQVIGTAIIKKDKLIGFLDGEETKDLIFIKNEIKGGLLIQEIKVNDIPTSVSLEIFNNKTKVKPVEEGKNIKMNLNIDTTVAIDEISGTENFIDEVSLKKLVQIAENSLKKRIETLIKKVQSEYNADIFGFGTKLREDKVKVWKSVSNNWDQVFKALKVEVKTKVHIENSSVLAKTLEKGE